MVLNRQTFPNLYIFTDNFVCFINYQEKCVEIFPENIKWWIYVFLFLSCVNAFIYLNDCFIYLNDFSIIIASVELNL